MNLAKEKKLDKLTKKIIEKILIKDINILEEWKNLKDSFKRHSYEGNNNDN